jgi:hypothetical protein
VELSLFKPLSNTKFPSSCHITRFTLTVYFNAWTRGILEKLTVVQLIKKSSCFYGNRHFIIILSRSWRYSQFSGSANLFPSYLSACRSSKYLHTPLVMTWPGAIGFDKFSYLTFSWDPKIFWRAAAGTTESPVQLCRCHSTAKRYPW